MDQPPSSPVLKPVNDNVVLFFHMGPFLVTTGTLTF
jgi:hypothetical protein